MTNHEYKRALISYQIGLRLLSPTNSNNNESNNHNRALEIALRSNLAMVHLKLCDYASCISECGAVLALDPMSPKIWLRLACAKQLLVTELGKQEDTDDTTRSKVQTLLQGASQDVAKA